jgi:MFS family permease
MRYEQRLIWVLGITFGFLFLDRNAASFVMPFIVTDLGLNNKQVGLIASALSFTWAISAFLGGALSDRTGRRKAILLASVVAFSLCSFLSGLAASVGDLWTVPDPVRQRDWRRLAGVGALIAIATEIPASTGAYPKLRRFE